MEARLWSHASIAGRGMILVTPSLADLRLPTSNITSQKVSKRSLENSVHVFTWPFVKRFIDGSLYNGPNVLRQSGRLQVCELQGCCVRPAYAQQGRRRQPEGEALSRLCRRPLAIPATSTTRVAPAPGATCAQNTALASTPRKVNQIAEPPSVTLSGYPPAIQLPRGLVPAVR